MLEFFTNLTKTNDNNIMMSSYKTRTLIVNTEEKTKKITYADNVGRDNQMRNFHNKIVEMWTTNGIKEFVKDYDDEIIFDVIRKYWGDIIKIKGYRLGFGHKYAIGCLVHDVRCLPVDMIDLFVKCESDVSEIEKWAHLMDVNYVNHLGRTCLWSSRNISYVISLLQSKVLNFNVNHLDNQKNTFVNEFLMRGRNDLEIGMLFDALVPKGYNFNMVHAGFTLLDKVCIRKLDMSIVKYIATNKFYDVTISSIWLYSLLKNYTVQEIILVLFEISQRADYAMFLSRIMNQYARLYPSADDDMLLVMSFLLHRYKNELVSMMMYVDESGNNLLHIASMNRLDKVIRFIMSNSEFGKLLLVKNVYGYYPKDLYVQSDVMNLLHKDVQLF